jgi:nucleoid-associated protein YgaU
VVERDQFFVTGSAEPGATVSIYVDNVFAGSGEVSDEGRFLIEERMPMTVGKHTIRADMTIGGEVVARAIVPFTRPDEGTAAAVASAPPAVDAPTAAGADDLLAAAEEAPAAAPNEPAEIESGSAEDAGDPAAPAAPEGSQTAATAGSEGVPELAATEESGENVAAPSSAEEGSAASQFAGEAPVVAPPAPGTGDGGAIVTLRQEPLEPTDSSVIIRRGDTLWEISRRVYGRGVRYTTIYLANDEQIANPDLILPGQVFTVPEESLDNAEELHRRRVLGLDG